MAKGRVDVSSVPDRVYAILREQILAGDLEPESRLHQEGISAELGVSRTPVREALARLAADGLVELLANRGARVAAIGDARHGGGLRRAARDRAAGRAAGGRRGATWRGLQAAQDEHAARGPTAAYAAARVPPRARGGVRQPVPGRLRGDAVGRPHRPARLRAADDARSSSPRTPPSTSAIMDAIEAGDEDAAERLTREHITHAQDVLAGRGGRGRPRAIRRCVSACSRISRRTSTTCRPRSPLARCGRAVADGQAEVLRPRPREFSFHVLTSGSVLVGLVAAGEDHRAVERVRVAAEQRAVEAVDLDAVARGAVGVVGRGDRGQHAALVGEHAGDAGRLRRSGTRRRRASRFRGIFANRQVHERGKATHDQQQADHDGEDGATDEEV